jgi:transmembrane sensor
MRTRPPLPRHASCGRTLARRVRLYDVVKPPGHGARPRWAVALFWGALLRRRPALPWLWLRRLACGVPSLAADLRTKTGEQRRVALASDVTIDLNTHTSVALRRDAGALHGVDLLDGEIAVNSTRGLAQPFVVAAGPGRAIATQASFEVRNLDARVCVTCLSGDVRVEVGGRSLTLTANQQVTYDKHALGAVAQTDVATTSAWRNGVLVFRQTPLSDVVSEINRYRPGHVLVVDDKLARSRLNGRFRIDRLDTVFVQIREVLGASVTELPGGIVLLG